MAEKLRQHPHPYFGPSPPEFHRAETGAYQPAEEAESEFLARATDFGRRIFGQPPYDKQSSIRRRQEEEEYQRILEYSKSKDSKSLTQQEGLDNSAFRDILLLDPNYKKVIAFGKITERKLGQPKNCLGFRKSVPTRRVKNLDFLYVRAKRHLNNINQNENSDIVQLPEKEGKINPASAISGLQAQEA